MSFSYFLKRLLGLAIIWTVTPAIVYLVCGYDAFSNVKELLAFQNGSNASYETFDAAAWNFQRVTSERINGGKSRIYVDVNEGRWHGLDVILISRPHEALSDGWVKKTTTSAERLHSIQPTERTIYTYHRHPSRDLMIALMWDLLIASGIAKFCFEMADRYHDQLEV